MSQVTSKEPFEKVRSQVERKKLIDFLVVSRVEIICKSESSLFLFVADKLMDETIVTGKIKAIEGEPKPGEEVVGNFTAIEERYFFRGTLKTAGAHGALNTNAEIYKLQRRQTHRVMIPPEMKIKLTVKKLGSLPVFFDAKFHDISAGGARIFFPPAELAKLPQAIPKIEAEYRISAVIHSHTGKTLDVEGVIKHILKLPDGQEHYGVQFDTDKEVTRNRMMSLVMDIQHRIVTGMPKEK